jgi:hypothetical protein
MLRSFHYLFDLQLFSPLIFVSLVGFVFDRMTPKLVKCWSIINVN